MMVRVWSSEGNFHLASAFLNFPGIKLLEEFFFFELKSFDFAQTEGSVFGGGQAKLCTYALTSVSQSLWARPGLNS